MAYLEKKGTAAGLDRGQGKRGNGRNKDCKTRNVENMEVWVRKPTPPIASSSAL